MFALIAMAWVFAVSPAAAGQASGFQRHTPAVATDGVKPGGRQGRVSRESLSIAACRARAAREGEASFKDMRLVGRYTYLVTGSIAPRRKAADRRGRARSYSCTVRGEGEILAFKIGPVAR